MWTSSGKSLLEFNAKLGLDQDSHTFGHCQSQNLGYWYSIGDGMQFGSLHAAIGGIDEMPRNHACVPGHAGDSSWTYIANGCNAPIPPDSCIDNGALVEGGIRSRRPEDAVTKSVMVMWHLMEVREFYFEHQELKVLRRAAITCIPKLGTPLNLNEAGNCLLAVGQRVVPPYVPKAILMVPTASSGGAAPRGSIFFYSNLHIIPLDGRPIPLVPVVLFILK